MTTLNEPQQEAVLCASGPLLVFAGAGSGKTRVTTERIARLVDHHRLHPDRILAVTFTNKAAGEMRERLRPLLGDDAKRLWLGTFHSIGARMLRSFAESGKTGRTADFSIYDESDQKTVVRQVCEELLLDKKRHKAADILEQIGKAKERAFTPDDIPEEDEFVATMVKVWRRYETFLQHANAFDFEDLLLVPMRLAESSSDTGEYIRNRFDHVLVDEFQDTSHTQYRLVRAMSARTQNLMVTGDDDQGIYGWRSADVRIIRDFAKSFPAAKVVKLEQNYRSTGNIVQAALEVIRPSPSRVPKELWTTAAPGAPVRLSEHATDRDEGRAIAAWLQVRVARGQGLGSTAILYRTHQVARAIEEPLRNLGVPYAVIGGPRYYDRREVKDVLAYLRLTQNQSSHVDFVRAIQNPPRGIGPAKIARLQELATSRGLGLWEAVPVLLASGELRPKEHVALNDFHELLNVNRARAKPGRQSGALREVRVRPSVIAKDLIEGSRYHRMWLDMAKEAAALGKHDDYEDALERGKNVLEILSAIESFEDEVEEDGGVATLASYLERVALMTSADEPAEGRVVLMTIHAAKGLEFDQVVVAACEEGILPYGNSVEHPGQLDEERRLMYVAVTRARKELWLSWAGSRYMRGELKMGMRSRFVRDISSEICTGDVEPDKEDVFGIQK